MSDSTSCENEHQEDVLNSLSAYITPYRHLKKVHYNYHKENLI